MTLKQRTTAALPRTRSNSFLPAASSAAYTPGMPSREMMREMGPVMDSTLFRKASSSLHARQTRHVRCGSSFLQHAKCYLKLPASPLHDDSKTYAHRRDAYGRGFYVMLTGKASEGLMVEACGNVRAVEHAGRPCMHTSAPGARSA